jgi:hypothetical protein
LQTKLRDKAATEGDKDWEVKVKQFVPVQSAADEAAALSSVKGTPSVNDRRYGAKPGSAYWRHLRIGVKEPVNDRRNGATSGSP